MEPQKPSNGISHKGQFDGNPSEIGWVHYGYFLSCFILNYILSFYGNSMFIDDKVKKKE